MRAIRSILVVANPAHPEDPALRRAALIARGTGADLHLLAFDTQHDWTEALGAIAERLRGQGHTVTARQVHHALDHQSIIAAQLAEGCGLVVKQHLPDGLLQKTLLTPEDWKLLRYCPCPVLLAKSHTPWLRGRVLAAIDVDTTDQQHAALHARIVEYGFDMAHLLGGELHVMSAHPSLALGDSDPAKDLKNTLEAGYRAACKAFQDEYGVSDHQLHVREGPADTAIPQVARELEAVVCVLGSVARTGFSGVLMGNTAEVVLDELDCDVLVIKPDALAEHLEELASKT